MICWISGKIRYHRMRRVMGYIGMLSGAGRQPHKNEIVTCPTCKQHVRWHTFQGIPRHRKMGN